MKKSLLIVATLAMLLVIPASVYAYSSSVFDSNPMFENFGFGRSENYNSMSSMMSSNHMSGMMSGQNIERCTDPLEHDEFIQEQKRKIEQDLANQNITEEEANELLTELDQMLQIHESHHQNEDTTYAPCH